MAALWTLFFGIYAVRLAEDVSDHVDLGGTSSLDVKAAERECNADADVATFETQPINPGEWRMAQVSNSKPHNLAAGVLNAQTIEQGTGIFWTQWQRYLQNEYHLKPASPPAGHVVVGLHGTNVQSTGKILSEIDVTKSTTTMFGPGFYMLNGYTVNDYRPAQNVSKLFDATLHYALQKSAEAGSTTGMIIGFCVSLDDLNGELFQVLSKVNEQTWEAVYASRDEQTELLPDPTASVWTPGWTGGTPNKYGKGGHMAEVKAGLSLAKKLKPFVVYKRTSKKQLLTVGRRQVLSDVTKEYI